MVHNADRLHEREWCFMQKLTHEGVVAQNRLSDVERAQHERRPCLRADF